MSPSQRASPSVLNTTAALAIDWSWPAAELRDVLRAIVERVELGPDMQPVRAVWRVPHWRAA